MQLYKAQQGPPAPLAVKRVLVKDLPLSVTLTENDAMLPQLSIAQFPNLELVARVSRSGQPTAQSGDLESAKLNIQNTEKNTLELVINRVVE